jgi:uroporphyrin-III C-methyltransferase
VTHRGYAPHVTIVTGHEAAREQGVSTGAEQQNADPVNWEALAALGGTLVILMGVKAMPCITRRLLEGGLDRETPAAAIQQGTTQRQRVVTGTLATIAQRAADVGLESPAITVVGAVAGLRESLAWFASAQVRAEAW